MTMSTITTHSVHPKGEHNPSSVREHVTNAAIWALCALAWVGQTVWQVVSNQGAGAVILAVFVCLTSAAFAVLHARQALSAKRVAAVADDADADEEAAEHQHTIIVQLDGKELTRTVVKHLPAVVRAGSGMRDI